MRVRCSKIKYVNNRSKFRSNENDNRKKYCFCKECKIMKPPSRSIHFDDKKQMNKIYLMHKTMRQMKTGIGFINFNI